MTVPPLAVLDLVPISSGSTAAEALRNSIDLAQQTERFGPAAAPPDRRRNRHSSAARAWSAAGPRTGC
ncbi:hypothetical protein ACFP2T_06320 [Plantactinospora solaniradicis]|uniref:Luciferase-like domain-containing protein n=1 Tax=Plantactinospora solaniradicis TaxID=1723736 RepID=A0ABW1K5M9_9ACTN